MFVVESFAMAATARRSSGGKQLSRDQTTRIRAEPYDQATRRRKLVEGGFLEALRDMRHQAA